MPPHPARLPLPRRSESWNGGYRAPGGAQVDGAFARSAFLFKFADSVGRAFVLRARSSANALRNGDVGELSAGGGPVGRTGDSIVALGLGTACSRPETRVPA